jgi:hypothetical protein
VAAQAQRIKKLFVRPALKCPIAAIHNQMEDPR